MKTRIFNKGKGWYISASNYKDKNDKAYMNLYFANNTAPLFDDVEGKGWVSIGIEIKEAKFTSYKNKLGLTIFSYILLKNDDLTKKDEYENFGGNVKYEDTYITQEELPFY